jgi:alpha-beta hydrolase superfamily lysophospholipase
MDSKELNYGENNKVSYFEMISQESNIGIIIIHGLAEHKGRYIEFINKLHSLKYSVFALDLIGHGESSGKKGDLNNFAEYVAELEKFVLHIRKNYPLMKIGLFGHSLGGLVACWYVSEYKNGVTFLILSNPLLEREKILNVFYILPYKILGFMKFKKRHSESKEMLEYSRKDPLACKYMTLRLLGEIFIIGINYNRKRLPYIETPLLLLGGSEDNLTKSHNLENIIKHFGSKDKTLKIYDGIKHRLVHSARKNEVISDISTWINGRVK